MAKKCYVGVSSKARKVKKIYVGVGGVARKVKKAYVGVGGVARLWWSGGTPARYGVTSSQLSTTGQVRAASVGNYAFFVVGGQTVNAYSNTLARSTPTQLTTSRTGVTGASIGDYALFAGGSNSGAKNTVDYYTKTKTHGTASTGLSVARSEMAGGTLGNYAVFAGGDNGSAVVNTVDAYNSSLTRTTASSSLGTARDNPAAANAGNYLVIAGGANNNNNGTTSVDAYNASLTKVSVSQGLTSGALEIAGASNSKHALFAGGGQTPTASYPTHNVDCYDSGLVRTTVSQMPTHTVSSYALTQSEMSGASLDGYAFFSGGHYKYQAGWAGYDLAVDAVYTYDEDLTLVAQDVMETARYRAAGATVGDYVLFAGGYAEGGSALKSVEVYMVA